MGAAAGRGAGTSGPQCYGKGTRRPTGTQDRKPSRKDARRCSLPTTGEALTHGRGHPGFSRTAQLPFNRSGGGPRGRRSSSVAICRARALSFCGTRPGPHPPGPFPLGQLASHVPFQKADMCPVPCGVTQHHTLQCAPWAGRPSGPERSSTDGARAGDGYAPALWSPRPLRGNTRPASSVLRGGLGVRTAPTWLPHSHQAKGGTIPFAIFVRITQSPGRAVLPAPSAGAGASCRKRARGVWGSQERSGAAPLPTQLFPRPSPLAQSPRGFPADPKEVDHWLAPPSFLPQPCPPQGAGLPALESLPQSPGPCSPARQALPPAHGGGLSTSGASWSSGTGAPLQFWRWDSRLGGQNVPEPH